MTRNRKNVSLIEAANCLIGTWLRDVLGEFRKKIGKGSWNQQAFKTDV